MPDSRLLTTASEGVPPAGPPRPAAPAPRNRRPSSWVATLAVAAVFGVLLGRFIWTGSDDAPAPSPGAPANRSAESRVAALQERLRATPDEPLLLTDLGAAYLARARETADPGFFAKAGQALERSDGLAPSQPRTLVAQGLLALALHDFARALDLGRRAHDLLPDSADPLGVIVDALVDLGRYPEAAVAAQQMVDLRPSIASLSRVSYLRELNGDPAGAVAAMTQAVTAGSRSADDLAYVRTLLGDLRVGRGELDAADASYARALEDRPGYGLAEVGRARVAAARGDLAGAAALLEPAVNRLPLPVSVALLGDVYAALGREADAAAQYDLVRRIIQLERAGGVAVDLERARFEADHSGDPGADPSATVEEARAALAQRPTLFAEDALGWALRQAGRPEEALAHARNAVRLGTRDALLWWHLARVEADLGLADDAREHLATAFSINPYVGVRDLPAARALASELGVPTP